MREIENIMERLKQIIIQVKMSNILPGYVLDMFLLLMLFHFHCDASGCEVIYYAWS